MSIDYIARAGVLGVVVLATAQLGFGVKNPLLLWAYLPCVAMLIFWSSFNARGKAVKDALLEATLPILASLGAVYCAIKFLANLR